MQTGPPSKPKSNKHKEYFKSRLKEMHATLDKQEDLSTTCMTLLESVTQIPEDNLLLLENGEVLVRLRLTKLQGTIDTTSTDFNLMTERICNSIKARHKELTQQEPPSDTQPKSSQDKRNVPETGPTSR